MLVAMTRSRPHADGGAIERRARATSSRLDKDSEPVAQLQAEYWLDPQDGAGLYHAVFTTPLLEQSEALLEMFDAIVSTVRAVRAKGQDHDAERRPLVPVATVS